VALLAVEGAVDHVAGIGERGGELPIEIGIVLDDEETHEFLPLMARDDSIGESTIAGATLPLHMVGGKVEEGRWRFAGERRK